MSESIKDIGSLDKATRGTVYQPGSAGYDRERTGFQLLQPHRPALIVAAEDADDVCAAVRFAAERGLRVAVQSSGHGLAAAMEGDVLISTRRMDGATVDTKARTAWLQAGASWQKVIEAAAPGGLAPLSGSMPSVGAVSYTLGGGIGLMARRYGFAADHVRRIDLVTADGELRSVDADSDPELFWGLRGGGGNFGVVTKMEIRLVAQTRLFGGYLQFDAKRLPDVLQCWLRWTQAVPQEMTSAATTLVMPSLPAVPEPLRGRQLISIQIAYLGSVRDGERLVEPLRALGRRLRDTLREIPYTESGSVFDEPDTPQAYRSSNRLLSGLDSHALAQATTLAGPSAPVRTLLELRHLGGALTHPPRVPNAIGHRQAAYSLTVMSPVKPGDEDTVSNLHHDVTALFSPQVVGRSLNFSSGPLTDDEIHQAYTPHGYQRLAELKGRLDPSDLLHVNHAIQPSPQQRHNHRSRR